MVRSRKLAPGVHSPVLHRWVLLVRNTLWSPHISVANIIICAHNFIRPVRFSRLLIQETILRPQATRTRVTEDRRRIQTSNNYGAFIQASHPFSDIASLCKALTGSMGCCDLSFFGSGLTCRTNQTGKPDRPLSRINVISCDGTPKGYMTSKFILVYALD